MCVSWPRPERSAAQHAVISSLTPEEIALVEGVEES